MFATSAEILKHFAEHLYLVHGVAEFHRQRVSEIVAEKRHTRHKYLVQYQNLGWTSSVTAQKCRGPLGEQGLHLIAEDYGVSFEQRPWDAIDGELLALTQPLCATCAAKEPMPAERPKASWKERKRFYFWLDSYINDMRSAAQIVKTYLDAIDSMMGDPLADDLYEPAAKTAALLIHAAACTSESADREHDQHSKSATKPRILEHLKLYTPRPVPAAWFGLRPKGLCADCKRNVVPKRITTRGK